MKKLVSIFLLGLFVFHHVGYYFVFKALKRQNDLAWQARVIQNDFDAEQLQMASIPITFPYQSNQKEYEYVDESIELNGNFYRIVKKRYARDTLHIVYVDDHKSEKIHNNLKDWANQLAQNDKNSQSKDTQTLLRLIQSQYIRSDYAFRPLNTSTNQFAHSEHYNNSFSQVFLSIPVPPPKSGFIS